MSTGDMCRVPPAAVHPGRARQCSGTGPCGYCWRALWVLGPRGQYSGKIRFIEKPGIQDEGVSMWLNVGLTPGICTKSSMSAFPFTFMLFPHIMFHETSHIKFRQIDRYWYWPFAKRMHARTVERTHDRTSQKQYTRSLVFPSWRHETWSGALCEGITHTLRIKLL